MSERNLTLPPHLQSASIAFGELTTAFGGQTAAASETGKSQSRICAYAHQNMVDMPPLDVIDTLEARTVGLPGHPHVTRWLARRRGYELVKLPDAVMVDSNFGRLAAGLAKEAGEVTSGVCNDLADDNRITAREARGRLKDTAELVRVAVELDAAMRACAEGDD